MPRRLPNVFLSSTFYDLRHVRAELRRFVVDELGYNLLSSESADFPVDPSTDAIENCRRRVENEADIFVLVIGSRYGHVSSGADISVTNVEYRVARAKAIPTFAFIQRDTLALLEAWRRNPDGNFDGLVDSPRVFEFIQAVRETDSVWTFPFELAADIVDALRKQFAYMMSLAVDLTRHLSGRITDVDTLTGEALRLVVDRPPGWPALLFAEVLREQLRTFAPRRMENRRGIALGASEIIAHENAPSWLKAAVAEATRTIAAARVAPEHINQAIAAADVARIRSSASELVAAYQYALEWSSRLRRAYVPELWQELFTEKSLWLEDVLTQIESLPDDIDKQIAAASAAPVGAPRFVTITLTLRLHNEQRIEQALQRVNRILDEA